MIWPMIWFEVMQEKMLPRTMMVSLDHTEWAYITNNISGYTRPHTAGKASGVNNTQSTQVARYGMAFDDNSEVLWDGSMRSSTFSSNIPRARPRKPVAGGTISKAPATAMVKVAPQVVKLKHLTRTVSRKSGTLSPEKGMQRRTSVLSTFKAPFKPQRTGDHEPMMREKR